MSIQQLDGYISIEDFLSIWMNYQRRIRKRN